MSCLPATPCLYPLIRWDRPPSLQRGFGCPTRPGGVPQLAANEEEALEHASDSGQRAGKFHPCLVTPLPVLGPVRSHRHVSSSRGAGGHFLMLALAPRGECPASPRLATLPEVPPRTEWCPHPLVPSADPRPVLPPSLPPCPGGPDARPSHARGSGAQHQTHEDSSSLLF